MLMPIEETFGEIRKRSSFSEDSTDRLHRCYVVILASKIFWLTLIYLWINISNSYDENMHYRHTDINYQWTFIC